MLFRSPGVLAYFAAIIASRRIAAGALPLLSADQKVRLVDLQAAQARRFPLALLLVLAAFVSLAWWPRQHLVTGWRICCLLFLGLLLMRGLRALRRLGTMDLPAPYLAAQRRALIVLALGTAALAAATLLAFR